MANVERWARLGRWFMVAWVLFTVPSAVSVAISGLGLGQLAILFAFVVWAANWVWFWMRGLGVSRAAEVVGLLANTAIMSLFAFFAPDPIGVGGVLVFSFIIAGVAFPVRQALWLVFGLSVLQVLLMIARQEPFPMEVSSLLNSVLVGGVGVGARLLWQSYLQLASAREQLAHVAVNEERLRFARDLHDLLGQSLSVLVLKSELVAKQLPADADESLRVEVRDIAKVARRSLNDVREAVAGYRSTGLTGEISNARAALRAAGIGFAVEDALGSVSSNQDAVLAWCLREAVTNVVKHSRAAQCKVRLSRSDGSLVLEVADDGRGAVELENGSGLVGMRERVEQAGGSIDIGSGEGGGMRLQVAVPAGSAT